MKAARAYVRAYAATHRFDFREDSACLTGLLRDLARAGA
jgi:hypothetical protein